MFSHDFIWTLELELPKQWEDKYNYLFIYLLIYLINQLIN